MPTGIHVNQRTETMRVPSRQRNASLMCRNSRSGSEGQEEQGTRLTQARNHSVLVAILRG